VVPEVLAVGTPRGVKFDDAGSSIRTVDEVGVTGDFLVGSGRDAVFLDGERIFVTVVKVIRDVIGQSHRASGTENEAKKEEHTPSTKRRTPVVGGDSGSSHHRWMKESVRYSVKDRRRGMV